MISAQHVIKQKQFSLVKGIVVKTVLSVFENNKGMGFNTFKAYETFVIFMIMEHKKLFN